MKHKISLAFVFCLAIAMATVFTTRDAWSEKKNTGQATQVQKKEKGVVPTGEVRMPKKTNPAVTNIYASMCPCKDEVEANGGFLMRGVYVRLKNFKCGVLPTTPVNGKVNHLPRCASTVVCNLPPGHVFPMAQTGKIVSQKIR